MAQGKYKSPFEDNLDRHVPRSAHLLRLILDLMNGVDPNEFSIPEIRSLLSYFMRIRQEPPQRLLKAHVRKVLSGNRGHEGDMAEEYGETTGEPDE